MRLFQLTFEGPQCPYPVQILLCANTFPVHGDTVEVEAMTPFMFMFLHEIFVCFYSTSCVIMKYVSNVVRYFGQQFPCCMRC